MFEKRKLLLVEDDPHEIESIIKLLTLLKINYYLATTVDAAKSAISKEAFDYLLTDLHIETKAGLERPDGLLVIKEARENQPNITIVATSSDPRTEIWNQTLAAGAHHFIRKPVSKADEIIIAFGLARDRRLFQSQSDKTSKPRAPSGRWKKYADGYPYGIVISERELRLAQLIARKRDDSFLITGETGTGKEEIAKLIYRFRSEAEGAIPFVAVNCATISANLAESLLFGHRKGAFTGADHSTNGFIGEADGGILFLDEIHTLEISTQQKLLRVLNDGTFNRLGETKTHRSQFQLLAATTKDLDDEIDKGRFLIDIRSRMTGIEMQLPPLRQRKEDLPALIALFLSRMDITIDDEDFKDLAKKLQTFYWAGNIRQLFKALGTWITLCEFDAVPLTVENFPVFKGMQEQGGKHLAAIGNTDDVLLAADQDRAYDEVIAEYERLVLSNALRRHDSIATACNAIKLSRSTFDGRRRKLGLL